MFTLYGANIHSYTDIHTLQVNEYSVDDVVECCLYIYSPFTCSQNEHIFVPLRLYGHITWTHNICLCINVFEMHFNYIH